MKVFIYDKETGEVISAGEQALSDPPLRLSAKEIERGWRVYHTTPETENLVSLRTRFIKFANTGPREEETSAAMPTFKDVRLTRAIIKRAILPDDVKEIVFLRTHKSIGDLVSIVSAIQSARKQRPSARIIVKAPMPARSILKNHPDIDELCDIDAEVSNDDAVTIDLSHPCPCGEYESAMRENIDKSRNEIFTIASGLEWRNERPKLYLTKEEIEHGFKIIDNSKLYSESAVKVTIHDNLRKSKINKSKLNIGVVLRSAEKWKDWPHVLDFIELAKKDYNIFLFDKSRKLDNVTNIVGLSLREVMSVLVHMDCVISPDTGIMHLSDALNVQCVVLLGGIPMKIHQDKYPSSLQFIQGKCIRNHSPCFYNTCSPISEYQPCMKRISAKQVYNQIKCLKNKVMPRKQSSKYLYVIPQTYGDAFLSKSIIASLAKKHCSRIDVMTKPSSKFMFMRDTNVANIIEYPGNKAPMPLRCLPNFNELERKYEQIFTPYVNLQCKNGYIAKLRGANTQFAIDYAMQCGIAREELIPKLLEEESFFLPSRNFIVAQTTSRVNSKNWSYFQELFYLIRNSYPKLDIIHLGDKNEKEFHGTFSFFGLNFYKVSFVVNRAKLYVGIDSIIAHMSGLAHIPTIEIFGGTDSVVSKAWGDKVEVIEPDYPISDGEKTCNFACHRECNQKIKCIDTIKPEIVMERIKKWLPT
jgi:ADP-heptose:LPS heptosyltransferase